MSRSYRDRDETRDDIEYRKRGPADVQRTFEQRQRQGRQKEEAHYKDRRDYAKDREPYSDRHDRAHRDVRPDDIRPRASARDERDARPRIPSRDERDNRPKPSSRDDRYSRSDVKARDTRWNDRSDRRTSETVTSRAPRSISPLQVRKDDRRTNHDSRRNVFASPKRDDRSRRTPDYEKRPTSRELRALTAEKEEQSAFLERQKKRRPLPDQAEMIAHELDRRPFSRDRPKAPKRKFVPRDPPREPREPPKEPAKKIPPPSALTDEQQAAILEKAAKRDESVDPSPAKKVKLESNTSPASPHPDLKDGSIYERIGQVGEGTYGKVYKAQHTQTKQFVALKRIRMEQEKDGFPITAMREIKLLQNLKSPGIVRLEEMMIEKGSVYMVFEYMDHDLTGILSNTAVALEPAHIKDLAMQLFQGLGYLHSRGILHRDIKASNILLNNAGQLKLADFGLARFYQKHRTGADYTNRVITLWFRPPELLLGETAYGSAVDIWSAGCIFLELFTKSPVFAGRDEIHQLEVIYDLLGSPTPETWPGATRLPWYDLVRARVIKPGKLIERFNAILTPSAMSFALSVLSLDPARRPDAETAVLSNYFSELPVPQRRTFSDIAESHEWETKQRKREERRKVAPAITLKKSKQDAELPVVERGLRTDSAELGSP